MNGWKESFIGIVGAGTMGGEVMFQLSKFGYKGILIDLNEEIFDEARARIRNIGLMDAFMQNQGKSPAGSNSDIFANISFSTDLNDLADCPIVIENVTEKFEVKKEVYNQLNEIISEDALVAVNTSATSITRIGALMKRPDKVIGIHFVNPVHLKPSVEMVRGQFTSEETISEAHEFLNTMEMKGILVNDFPGFVSNRVMLVYINEAIFCLQDQVATARKVDEIFRECLAHTMGPLETADLIGLDTILYSLEVLHNDFMDSKYRPAALLRKMVDANLLGRKTGEGFYKY